MPEQPEKWPRGAAWTLTHAHDAGQVAGMSRTSALEFSFFLSIPTMLAATGNELYRAIKPKAGHGADVMGDSLTAGTRRTPAAMDVVPTPPGDYRAPHLADSFRRRASGRR